MTDDILTTDTAPDAPPPPPQQEEASPLRLVMTLGIAGALAGFLIVFVYVVTDPIITANKARELQAAIGVVLGAPDQVDTLFVVDGTLQDEVPAGAAPEDFDQIYPGYRADGTQIGYAIQSGEFGFQDIVRVIFGYDADEGLILGMMVLEHKETPGLGDKIVKDLEWVGLFNESRSPLVGVKVGAGTGSPSEIDMITGATISSRAVIRIINNAIERLDPMIEAYNGGGSQ